MEREIRLTPHDYSPREPVDLPPHLKTCQGRPLNVDQFNEYRRAHGMPLWGAKPQWDTLAVMLLMAGVVIGASLWLTRLVRP